MKSEVIVFLDNIRSSHNVGSIFRTADGARVGKIYLAGYTPAPIDRFQRPVKEILKTSLGASEMVPWEAVTNEDTPALLEKLKKESFEIVAVEQTANSIDINSYHPSGKTCYIFGNEVTGVDPKLLEVADKVIEIPMHGSKESLNVSVTVGIVLFHK